MFTFDNWLFQGHHPFKWKNGTSVGRWDGTLSTWISGFCGFKNTTFSNVEEFYACLDAITYTQDEIINGTFRWNTSTMDFETISVKWEPIVPSITVGICQVSVLGTLTPHREQSVFCTIAIA